MKRILFAVLFSLLALPALAQQKQRVVIQVSDDDPAKWSLALSQQYILLAFADIPPSP